MSAIIAAPLYLLIGLAIILTIDHLERRHGTEPCTDHQFFAMVMLWPAVVLFGALLCVRDTVEAFVRMGGK